MNHRPSPAIHAYMVGAGPKRLAGERDAWIAQYFDLLASGFAYGSIKVALIHLNVLGLVVDVSQITITVTAQPGTLLGGLLCQLAGATTLQQIVSLLNQILALLGGV